MSIQSRRVWRILGTKRHLSSYADGRGSLLETNEPLIPIQDRLDTSMGKIRSTRGSNYGQLATVDRAGKPHVRTVVYRGHFPIHCESCRLRAMKIITDNRSSKIEHLLQNPMCEFVWWMPATMEQYRFASLSLIVSSDEQVELLRTARIEAWQALSDVARSQFYWPNPGSPFDSYSKVFDFDESEISRDSNFIPNTFTLLLLLPYEMRYLRLTDNYAQIDTLVDETNEVLGEEDIVTTAATGQDALLAGLSNLLVAGSKATKFQAKWNLSRIFP